MASVPRTCMRRSTAVEAAVAFPLRISSMRVDGMGFEFIVVVGVVVGVADDVTADESFSVVLDDTRKGKGIGCEKESEIRVG